MRTNRRIKQKMLYSNFKQSETIYVTDSEGNIVYRTMPDGNRIAVKSGEIKSCYEEPIEFLNSISGTLTEDEMEAFGGEKKAVAKITYRKGDFPFSIGTLIWKDSEVKYVDGKIDENSADYRILGILGRQAFALGITAVKADGRLLKIGGQHSVAQRFAFGGTAMLTGGRCGTGSFCVVVLQRLTLGGVAEAAALYCLSYKI